MRLIWRVAKTELQLLFLSPIAWILLIIFSIQSGMAFLNAYGDSVRYLVLSESANNITSGLFGSGSVFSLVQSKLYLYMPLLTMGLMSREISSGTVKLLYSSPITSTQIILGKFLSIVIYGFALITILGIFIIFSAFTVVNFDIPMVLTGLLGIFLLFCAYAAIGLFVSCLISYQVAVAVCTMAIFAALQYIGFVGQDIALFREIAYWLSISGRANEFINGMITSEDSLYFIILITLFLLFSIIKLKSNKLSNARMLTFSRYAIAFILAAFIGYLSGRPSLKAFADNTATKLLTLTPESQAIVKKLTGGLKVTTYVNLMDEDFSMEYAQPKQVLHDMEQLKQYVRFKPEMDLNYEFYYDEASRQIQDSVPLIKRARTTAEAHQLNFDLFKSPKIMRSQIDLSYQGYKMVRRFERENGASVFLNFYNDLERLPSEREISAALNILAGNAPTVGFLNGTGTRDPKGNLKKDYKYVLSQPDYRYALVNQGYNVVMVSPDRLISPKLNALIITDVNKPLSTAAIQNLKNYMDKGGNLLVCADLGNQAYLNPLLSGLGVQVMPGSVVQQSENERPDLILGQFSYGSSKVFPDVEQYSGGVITMPGAVALAFDTIHGFSANQILSSRNFGSWIKAKPFNLLDDKVTFHPEEGDKQGTFPVAVALTRKIKEREQRIFISGDADFLSNAELQASRTGVEAANVYFASTLFSWLCDDKLPLKMNRPIPPDFKINFAYEKLGVLNWIFLGFLPALFFVAGSIILLYRKRV